MTSLTSALRTATPYLILGLLLLFTDIALASEAETGLQWESPLKRFGDSMTGPVAFVISLIGLCITGAALIFGGELNEFSRRMIMVIMGISVIVFAGSILRTLFSGGAATITAHDVEAHASFVGALLTHGWLS